MIKDSDVVNARAPLSAPFVLATTGQIGSGKDTLVRVVCELLGAQAFNISDFVREEARAAGISLERKVLTNFSARLLAERGQDFFVQKCINLILQTNTPLAAVSGVRTPANVRALRDAFGRRFSLVEIYINDDRERYRRILARDSTSDSSDEHALINSDKQQENLFQLSKTLSMANIRIDNSGPEHSLRDWVKNNYSFFRVTDTI